MENDDVTRAAIGDLARVVAELVARLGMWSGRFVDDPALVTEMDEALVELHKIAVRIMDEFPPPSFGNDLRG